MSIDMETVKLLINVSTFSITQKINKLESISKQKFDELENKNNFQINELENKNFELKKNILLLEEEHKNKYNELKQKLEEQENIYNLKFEEQENKYNLKLDEQENKYNLELDTICNNMQFHDPKLSFPIYSKIIILQNFMSTYKINQENNYQFKSDIYIKSIHYRPNSPFERYNPFKPFVLYSRFYDPFLLISLNVYQKLKLIILPDYFIINVFTNDKMIDGHINNSDNSIKPIYTIFNSKPTPLFTVEIIVIPLNVFLSVDSSLDYETYTNFFKNIFPNLKTIYITVNHSNYIYNKNDFMKTSIEYGINYIINNTSIEKIIFTSYIICQSLSEDTIDYLKNIVNNNQTRNIILEIKNIITDKELIEISEL